MQTHAQMHAPTHTFIHTDSVEYSTVAFSKNATLTTYDICNTQDCCLVVLEKFFEDFCTFFSKFFRNASRWFLGSSQTGENTSFLSNTKQSHNVATDV